MILCFGFSNQPFILSLKRMPSCLTLHSIHDQQHVDMDLPVYRGPRTTRQGNLLFLCSVLCLLPFLEPGRALNFSQNEAALDLLRGLINNSDVLVQELGDASLYIASELRLQPLPCLR